MIPDRFGEIRIKPETENKSRDRRGGDGENRENGAVPANGPPRQAEPSAGAGLRRQNDNSSFRPGRVLFWVAVPLFLALLYGVGSYFLVPSLVKGPLTKNLSDSLGRPVAVDRVVFSPFTWRIFLTNISVGPVFGDLDKQNLLECNDFYCRIDFIGLFSRQVICHEVKVNGVALNLARFRLGSFSMDDAASFFSLIRGRGGQLLWPEWLVLDGVLMTDGSIIVNDSLARKQHRIEQIRFYLPSAGKSVTGVETMPRLNAVINSSPVQIDGIRRENVQGAMETRFTLRFSKIVLQNYLEYLPVLQQNPFHLAEGQADINVDLVIPEIGSEAGNVNIQLDAQLEALQFVNKNGQTVMKAPRASLNVLAVPARNRYIVRQAELSSPEFTLGLQKQQAQQQSGLSFTEIANFLHGLERYPHGISIERFSFRDGKLNVLRDSKKPPLHRWESGKLLLTGFMNLAARNDAGIEPPPAEITISGREVAGTAGAQLKAGGSIHAPLRFTGKLSLKDVDLKAYSLQLPGGIQFTGGRAEVESEYTYVFNADAAGNPDGYRAQLADGTLAVREYTLLRDGGAVLSGDEIACRQMQVDFSGSEMRCEEVAVVKSRIEGSGISLAYLADEKTDNSRWSIRGRKLTVTDSILHARAANPFIQDQKSSFTLKKFSLQAVNLQEDDHENTSLKASAVIGEKGTVDFSGTYSAVSGRGRLQATLNGLELQLLKEYIDPWFKAEIESGELDAEGSYRIGEQEFTGRVRVKNLHSGKEPAPSLQWQEAEAESLFIKTAPFSLECAEINIIRPEISFGISHADNPVTLFLHPVKLPASPDAVTIHKIRFADGIFAMPEPVIAPGYQPELSGLTGTLSPVGSDTMYFFIRGAMEEQGNFVINGTTGLDSISEYTLEVADVSLAPFQPLFSTGIGLDVAKAVGSWQQKMQRTEMGCSIENRLHLQQVVPDPGSPYFKTTALYTDNDNSIQLTDEVACQHPGERQFLFNAVIRRMRHDAVRADLSAQLLLNRLLPELNLQGMVSFVPGTATLVVTKDLADYELLLDMRPYLRLLLIGQYDPLRDAESLQVLLQQEEDEKREAENRRRAEERSRLDEEEQKRLAELKNDPQQVVEEEINPVELSADLQPLPYREVQVKPAMLIDLARERTAALYDFFVNGLLIPPDQVHSSGDSGQSGAEVHIRVQPYHPIPSVSMEVDENDTSNH